ncbi:THUM1-like protein [Mya arenaria]|uniref:THUM1-like protein n=1 Tax=Mya arenaria TaxID=6604 RepID=A0ABY7DG21_MYAAR|nr:THUMP domain-containing protein 1 homolog [Mya arenaria]WAQ96644.1 THUM1-like protein [Mya arenaria]
MSEKRKKFYRKCGNKKHCSQNDLDADMRGFLVTCNTHERETVREMYNLLNEYADKVYGPEVTAIKEAAGDDTDDDDDDDMEKALAKERENIIKMTKQTRRFQNTNTHCKNIIFIRTTLENPCQLAHQIFQEMLDTGIQKARYSLRMTPISLTCKANMKTIEKTLTTVLKERFETPFGVGIRYTGMVKVRNNDSVKRTTVLSLIDRTVKELNPLHQKCVDAPEVVVIFEVIRNVALISVVEDYEQFRKYNFHEVIKVAQKRFEPSDAKKEGETEASTDSAMVEEGNKAENAKGVGNEKSDTESNTTEKTESERVENEDSNCINNDSVAKSPQNNAIPHGDLNADKELPVSPNDEKVGSQSDLVTEDKATTNLILETDQSESKEQSPSVH